MRVVFTRSFQTSSRGDGFEAGKIYDLTPSNAEHWKRLGVAKDAPAEEPVPEVQAESPAPEAPVVPPARRSRRAP